MKSIGALFLITIFLASAGMPARADQEVDQLLKQVSASMKTVRTLTAVVSVAQTNDNKTVWKVGAVKLMKPNLLREEFWPANPSGSPKSQGESSPHEILASDGTTYWQIADNGKLYKEQAQADGENVGNTEAFSGNGSSDITGFIVLFFIPDAFTQMDPGAKTSTGVEDWDGDVYQVISITDKTQDKKGHTSSTSGKIYIGKDNLIHRIVFSMDTMGTSDLQLTNVKTDVPLATADFAFMPPAWAKPAKETASSAGATNSASALSHVGQAKPPKVTMDRQSARLLKQVARRMQTIRTLTADYSNVTQYRARPGSKGHGEVDKESGAVILMKPNLAQLTYNDLWTRNQPHELINASNEVECSDGKFYWYLWDTKNKYFSHYAVDPHGHNIHLYDSELYQDFFDPSQSVYSRLHTGWNKLRLSSITVRYKGSSTWHGASYKIVQAYLVGAKDELMTDEIWFFYIGPNGLIDHASYHENWRIMDDVDEEYTLSNIRINAPLSHSQFAFKLPPGYRAKNQNP